MNFHEDVRVVHKNFGVGYERTAFKQSRKALVSEWSITSGLSQSETMGEIDECLEHRK